MSQKKYNYNAIINTKPGTIFTGYSVVKSSIEDEWDVSGLGAVACLDEKYSKIKSRFEPSYVTKSNVEIYVVPIEKVLDVNLVPKGQTTFLSAKLFATTKHLGLFLGGVLRANGTTWVNILTPSNDEIWIVA